MEALLNRIESFELSGKGDNYAYTALFKDGSRVRFGRRGASVYRIRIPKEMVSNWRGSWPQSEHKDKEVMRNWFARMTEIRRKNGARAISVRDSPLFLSAELLWR